HPGRAFFVAVAALAGIARFPAQVRLTVAVITPRHVPPSRATERTRHRHVILRRTWSSAVLNISRTRLAKALAWAATSWPKALKVTSGAGKIWRPRRRTRVRRK